MISQGVPGTWSRSLAFLLSVQSIPLGLRVKARAGSEWWCQPEKPQEGGLVMRCLALGHLVQAGHP